LFYIFDKNEGSLEDVKHMYLFFFRQGIRKGIRFPEKFFQIV
jgi:hypothetical protein